MASALGSDPDCVEAVEAIMQLQFRPVSASGEHVGERGRK